MVKFAYTLGRERERERERERSQAHFQRNSSNSNYYPSFFSIKTYYENVLRNVLRYSDKNK